MSGGIVILRKNFLVINIIKKWYISCCNYDILDDYSSNISNDPEFIEHRHDQAIYSLLCYKYKVKSINDETYFPDWNSENVKKMPILVKLLK